MKDEHRPQHRAAGHSHQQAGQPAPAQTQRRVQAQCHAEAVLARSSDVEQAHLIGKQDGQHAAQHQDFFAVPFVAQPAEERHAENCNQAGNGDRKGRSMRADAFELSQVSQRESFEDIAEGVIANRHNKHNHQTLHIGSEDVFKWIGFNFLHMRFLIIRRFRQAVAHPQANDHQHKA